MPETNRTEYDGAKWMRSPNYDIGRGGAGPERLEVHLLQGVGGWFQNPESGASTHYVVDQKGDVVQCVREKDTAWGNGRIEKGAKKWWNKTGNPNRVTISIEHVKSARDNSNQLTTAQKKASFKLIANIIKRNPWIKPKWADDTGGITGHHSISPKSRAKCPGPFPWDELFQYLNKQGNQRFIKKT
ncbi:N-acetylmuramoyl-L-alanine amidase A, partial [Orchesella cincta]